MSDKEYKLKELKDWHIEVQSFLNTVQKIKSRQYFNEIYAIEKQVQDLEKSIECLYGRISLKND